MKTNYSKICALGTCAFFLLASLNSCVNEDYSLDKEFNGDIVILKDLTMPIGNLSKISVGEIISLNDTDQMITSESNGDYVFKFSGVSPFSANFKVPAFSIPFEEGTKADNHYISINTGSLSGSSGPSENKQIRLDNQRLEKIIKVNESHQLPYQISDIKRIDTGILVDYNFSTSVGAIHIAKGFQIDFQDWIVIEKNDNLGDYVVENQGDNKNVVRFLNDVKVAKDSPYVLKLKIKTVYMPEGSVVAGGNDAQGRPCKKVRIDEENPANMIIATGSVFIETKDFPTVPDKADLKLHLELSEFDVKSANLQLNMSTSVSDQVVPIAEYPEFFNNDGIVIDLYNPVLTFTADNKLPVSLDFDAEILAYKNSELKVDTPIEDFHINASTVTQKTYSAIGDAQGNDKLPELRDIIRVMPDDIKVSGITVSTAGDYADIVPGHVLNCTMDYELSAPLAFGPDFRLDYEMDIDNVGASLKELGLQSANLVMKVENTIPLNFTLQPHALDVNGNVLENISVNVVGQVAPGILSSPVVSDIQIKLTTTDESVDFQSLKLKLTATCPSDDHQGVALNKEQGLKISSISINLPSGLTMDLNDMLEDPTPEENN
jgi:hypothetical protein